LKYSSDEAFAKIMKKSVRIREKRERRVTALLSAACVTLSVLLIGTVILWKEPTASEAVSSQFGAFLLPSRDGGYVLAAVIAFFLGIAVTLLAIRYKNRGKHKEDDDREESL